VTGAAKISQAVRRREDARFVTGRGTYSDDVSADGQAYACFVRSQHAHGIVRSVNTVEAQRMPGVLAVFTGEDLKAAGIGGLPFLPIPGIATDTPVDTPRPALASEHVRYVGEQVALVVAETRSQAVDAAERVQVDIEPLPAVVTIEAAIAPGAPQLWSEAPGNVVLTWECGNRAQIEATCASAAHVTALRLVNNRVVANPMEPRAILATYDAALDLFRLTVCTQGVIYYRRALNEATFRLAPEKVHVRTHDVGGAFGNKEFPYPEDIAVMHAARVLGRPIKWTGTRLEHLLSDNHARDAVIECQLALDDRGHFLALCATVLTALGAYCSYVAPITAIRNTTFGLPMVYKTPLIAAAHKMVVTNTAPTGPYRGAGREQSVLIVERLIDQAARELNMDPIELRQRNILPRSAIPYRTPTGQTYESGDFDGMLEKALTLSDWKGFEARARASKRARKLRGRGVAVFVESVGGVPFEGAHIRFRPDGEIEAVVATQSQGQGHETTFAQVIADRLGVPCNRIRIRQGDSFDVPRGMGTFASRSMIMAGSALAVACNAVIDKGRQVAAYLLSVSLDNIEFADGMFRAPPTNLAIDICELAGRMRSAGSVPEGLPSSLDSTGEFTVKEFHYPAGCHVCEVEVAPETGEVAVGRHTAVDDVGRVVNPMIVHGQIEGGIAQGLGQALLEHCVYDESGQLVTASLMDYAMPRADNFPEPALDFHVVPSTANPLGVKGCGESGVTGSLAAISNAVADALTRADATAAVDMPFTSQKIWEALNRTRTE
jgi:carbon-monoxide dehydrogenase large subunit